jgi:CRISPR/Cas system-associated endonuclease Cas3-HD
MYKLHKLKNRTHHNTAHKEARIKTSNKKLYKPLQPLVTTAKLKTHQPITVLQQPDTRQWSKSNGYKENVLRCLQNSLDYKIYL